MLLANCPNSPDGDMQEDLGNEGMAEKVDTIARYTFIKESQPQSMSGLSYSQPYQSSQQDHARSSPQPTQGQC